MSGFTVRLAAFLLSQQILQRWKKACSISQKTAVFLAFSAYQGRSRMLPGPAIFAFVRFPCAPGIFEFAAFLKGS